VIGHLNRSPSPPDASGSTEKGLFQFSPMVGPQKATIVEKGRSSSDGKVATSTGTERGMKGRRGTDSRPRAMTTITTRGPASSSSLVSSSGSMSGGNTALRSMRERGMTADPRGVSRRPPQVVAVADRQRRERQLREELRRQRQEQEKHATSEDIELQKKLQRHEIPTIHEATSVAVPLGNILKDSTTPSTSRSPSRSRRGSSTSTSSGPSSTNQSRRSSERKTSSLALVGVMESDTNFEQSPSNDSKEGDNDERQFAPLPSYDFAENDDDVVRVFSFVCIVCN
jgi:hypothetical protein